MRRRVAEAVAAASGVELGRCLRWADPAIRAMREPLPKMVEAGMRCRRDGQEIPREAVIAIWHAMIDAAADTDQDDLRALIVEARHCPIITISELNFLDSLREQVVISDEQWAAARQIEAKVREAKPALSSPLGTRPGSSAPPRFAPADRPGLEPGQRVPGEPIL